MPPTLDPTPDDSNTDSTPVVPDDVVVSNVVNAGDYDTVTEALNAVSAGETLSIPAGTIVTESLTIDKDITIEGNGATFTASISISSANVVINNANLTYEGSGKSDKTAIVSTTGATNFTLTNSTVSGSTRTGLSLTTSGEVVLDGNTFDAGDGKIYNMIEFAIGSNKPNLAGATISNNIFTDVLGNNAISFYNVADGAVINIEGNAFNKIDTDNNPIRLSNVKNNSATFNIKNNTYSYNSDEATEYTGFILCQDYTKSSGTEQQFNLYTINIENLKRGDTLITSNGEGLDRVWYVYEDGTGILAIGENDPVVNFVA